MREPAPTGIPSKLLPQLADFFLRGFEAARARFSPPISLEGFDVESRGRPVEDEAEREGREAARLRNEGLTFGQIARQVCRYRGRPGHRCKKPCADRIRQAHQSYLRREEQRRTDRELTSSVAGEQIELAITHLR